MQKELLALTATTLLTGVAVADYPLAARASDKASAAFRGQKAATATEPSPLTCNLGAMTPAQRQRYDDIGKRLRGAVKEVKELPDGYGFRYSADSALFLAAAEFVTLESRCCSFYNFGLEFDPRGGWMWLRITGPREAKPLIKAVLAP